MTNNTAGETHAVDYPTNESSPHIEQAQQDTIVASKQQTDDHKDLESHHHHYHDCLHKKIGYSIGELFVVCCWFVLLGLYIWFLVALGIGHAYRSSHPSTSVSYVEHVPMPFPAVTVCNWNALYNCEYCNLTMDRCMVIGDDGLLHDCPSEIVPHYVHIEQLGLYFQCYQFNNDTKHVVEARKTGYSGTVSMYFRVPTNVKESQDTRKGLQVTFHEVGKEPSLFDETNFARPGYENYYTLTKFENTRLRPSEAFPDLFNVEWRNTYSKIELTQDLDTIVVSFSYATLNVNAVDEAKGAGSFEIFGEVCDMMLILLVSVEFCLLLMLCRVLI